MVQDCLTRQLTPAGPGPAPPRTVLLTGSTADPPALSLHIARHRKDSLGPEPSPTLDGGGLPERFPRQHAAPLAQERQLWCASSSWKPQVWPCDARCVSAPKESRPSHPRTRTPDAKVPSRPTGEAGERRGLKSPVLSMILLPGVPPPPVRSPWDASHETLPRSGRCSQKSGSLKSHVYFRSSYYASRRWTAFSFLRKLCHISGGGFHDLKKSQSDLRSRLLSRAAPHSKASLALLLASLALASTPRDLGFLQVRIRF